MTNVEKSNDYKVYLVPSHHPNKMYTHFVVLYDDSNHIRPLGDVKNDGSLAFLLQPHGGDEIFTEWDNCVEVCSIPRDTQLELADFYDTIAENVAKTIVNGKKPYSQPIYFTMEYMNSKGQVRDDWITVNRLTSEEAVVEYANNMIEKWRGGKENSKIQLLTIETDTGNDMGLYKIENGLAYKMESKLLVDNTSLSADDLSDLTLDEQSK
jgi:hypothetical protein